MNGPIFVGNDVSKVQGVAVSIDLTGVPIEVFGVCETKKTIEAGARLRGIPAVGKKREVPPTVTIPFDFKLLPPAPDRGDEAVRFRRLSAWSMIWRKFVERFVAEEVYVGIEDYAYGAQTQSYSLGECGGEVRLAYLWLDAPIRLHDPDTVKLWGADHGHATKEMMMTSLVQRRPDVARQFEPFLGMEVNIVEGLYDAYWIADMVRVEYLVRTGRLLHSDLTATQLRVFNRVTKSHPVNILGRDWSRA